MDWDQEASAWWSYRGWGRMEEGWDGEIMKGGRLQINIWSWSPWFLAHSSWNPWTLRSDECLLYGNGMTGGWEPLDSFRCGLVIKKTEASLESWDFQPHPLSSGKGRGTGDWVNHQWFNQSCLHNEISIKTPLWWGLGSLQVGEHIEMLVHPEGARKLRVFPFKKFTFCLAWFSLERIVN